MSAKTITVNLQGLAAAGEGSAGPPGRLRREGHLDRHVVPRDARRRQRRPHSQGRGRHRVRLGLPRGHLRRVRLHDQRRRARSGCGHDDLPASHAAVHRRPDDRHRAVAGEGLPGPQGSHRRSHGVRSHHRSRRLHLGGRRRRAGREQHPGSQGQSDAAMDSAACIGCGACVAACKNAAAHLFTSAKITHLALLPQGEPERERPRRAHGRIRWKPKALATARTKANAKPCARS